jgi:hypothetical protein
MKRLLLPFFVLIGLGTVQTVHAQAALVNLVGLGLRLGTSAALKNKQAPKAAEQSSPEKLAADKVAADKAAIAASPQELVMQRTPTDKLPKKAAEQITSLEAQLDRCHTAMLADPKGVVCTPEQRTAIQSAAVNVARAQSSWNLKPYQQEMAFYMAEDARRQQPATLAEPVK